MVAFSSARGIIEGLACGERCECAQTVRAGHGKTHCPSHDDAHPSLQVSDENGKILVKCFAGCEQEHVLDALRQRGLWQTPSHNGTAIPHLNGRNGKAASGERKRADDWKPDVTYDYRDDAGELRYQVCRWGHGEGKDIFQRQPDPAGGWWGDLRNVDRLLYRLADLRAGADPVFIVEGEKDVDRLIGLGLTATTNSEGAEKWKPHLASWLRGRDVVIVPDNDSPGQRHAQKVATSLTGIAAKIRILNLPDVPPKGDVSDWLAAGGSRDALLRLAGTVPVWKRDGAGDIYEQLTIIRTDPESFRLRIYGTDLLFEKVEDFASHRKVQLLCYRKTGRIPPPLKPVVWDAQLERLYEGATFEDVPEEATVGGVIWAYVRTFLLKWSDSEQAIENRAPVLVEDRIYFRLGDLRNWLRQENAPDIKPGDLWELLKSRGSESGPQRLAGKLTRVWSLPVTVLLETDTEEALEEGEET